MDDVSRRLSEAAAYAMGQLNPRDSLFVEIILLPQGPRIEASKIVDNGIKKMCTVVPWYEVGGVLENALIVHIDECVRRLHD